MVQIRGYGQAHSHNIQLAERENLMLNKKNRNKRGINVYFHPIRGKPQ